MKEKVRQIPRRKATLYKWTGGALYVGEGAHTTPHTIQSIQFYISLNQPFDVQINQNTQWQPYQAMLINAGVLHEKNALACNKFLLLLDPISTEGRKLAQFYLQDKPLANVTNHLDERTLKKLNSFYRT